MKVAFYAGTKDREQTIARFFLAGVRVLGDTAAIRSAGEPVGNCDVACICGIDAVALDATAKDFFAENAAKGIRTVFFDKGYVRKKIRGSDRMLHYWRVAIDSNQPTDYLGAMTRPPDRWRKLGIRLAPWRKRGRHIIVAGSSPNYHRFGGHGDPTSYAADLVAEIRQRTGRPIIYRPKPSWTDAKPVPGAEFSVKPHTLADALAGAHALVTLGSNASWEAAVAGVPSVVLGDGIGRTISSTSLDEIENPRLASNEERERWFRSLAYCQWRLEEMRSGRAWREIRKHING